VELARGVWLDAKTKRSGSVDTTRAYRTTLDAFRQVLQERQLDLDSDPRAVALAAQL
jgi:hypothetical protein